MGKKRARSPVATLPESDGASDNPVEEAFSLFSQTAKKQLKKNKKHNTVDQNSEIYKHSRDVSENIEEDTTAEDEQESGVVEQVGADALEVENVTFKDLGLTEWLCKNVKSLGMKKPTHVQRRCIPAILRGDDVLGTARTGSGKTAAFALPMLHRLAEDAYGVFGLVMTPTRELAFQIVDQFRALGAGITLRVEVVIGGMDMTKQAIALSKRPHIVIATPGRLAEHFKEDSNMTKAFGSLNCLVLDEADRLLDNSFQLELRTIFAALPRKRQTLLFSATLTRNLSQLQKMSLNKAVHFLEYEGLQTVEASQLTQQYAFLPDTIKEVYLYYSLQQLEDWSVRSVIIFVNTCRMCQFLSAMLAELGVNHAALHAAKSQPERLRALDRFRSSQAPILIATDVASRGLDIPTVDLVLNYDLPKMPTEYVHRVGRTARAGRRGRCLTFVTQYDVELLQKIEEVVEQKLEDCGMEEGKALKEMNKVFKAKRVANMKLSESGGFDDRLQERKKLKKKRRKEQQAEEQV